MKLSVIMPFVCEYPQVLFTLQSLYNELRGLWERGSGHTFEVVVINNWCPEAAAQTAVQRGDGFKLDRAALDALLWTRGGDNPDADTLDILQRTKGGHKMHALANLHPWLKYVEYTDKLSHWQAKNAGVAASTGDVLFFTDAHCMIEPDTLVRMFIDYVAHLSTSSGAHRTYHMPIIYMMDNATRKLIYKPVGDSTRGEYHYSFTRFRDEPVCYPVAAMSTCGMMMSRALFDKLGGWPTELGIYGGGENFINYSMAVMGHPKMIVPYAAIWHYAEARGYAWNYDDYVRNRMIATFCFGGAETLNLFTQHAKGNPKRLAEIAEDVIDKCADHAQWIRDRSVYTIQDWWLNHRP